MTEPEFPDTPDVELLDPRRRIWRLKEDWRIEEDDFILIIPAGFLFDRASVPRMVWSVIAPDDLGTEGPLVHDFLYRCQGCPPEGTCWPPDRAFTRDEVDDLLARRMERDPRIVAWKRRLAWAGVRAGGWLPWSRAAARNAKLG